MKRYIPILFALVCFASCEKIMPVDDSDVPQQLVLNGVPDADKELFVNFSYTHFFLDNNASQPVSEVQMLMEVNGVPYPCVRHQGCNYFFGYTPQEDDQLHISITAGNSLVEADTYVPRKPLLNNFFSFVDTTDVFNIAMVHFDLQDHANYPDYYSFSISQRDSGIRMNPFTEKFDTVDTVYNTLFLCMGDPDLTDPSVSATEALGGYFYTRLLTTDGRIDGTLHPTNLIVMLLKDTNEVQPFLHEYTLHVEGVTPDRYEYLRSVDQSTSLMNIFAEQSQVYSNVHGALGIFAGNAHLKQQVSLSDTFHLPIVPPMKAIQPLLPKRKSLQ